MEMEEGASGVGEKIKIGVCVMEKKVKCGSEVLFSLFFCLFVARLSRFSTDQQIPITRLHDDRFVFFLLRVFSLIHSLLLLLYRFSQLPWGKFSTDSSLLVNLRFLSHLMINLILSGLYSYSCFYFHWREIVFF